MNTSRENHNAPWFRSAMQEIQAVVGRSASVLLRYRRRWPYLPSLCRVGVDAVLKNAFLIGAGAFQEAYRKRSSGFNSAAMQPARSMDHLLLETHTRKCLFNGDDFQLFSRCQWIILKPLSVDDLRRAASAMIDGPLRPHLENRLGTFVERASSTQAPFRTMESMIMMECLRILREQPLTGMSCGVPGDAGVVNAQ